MVKAGGRDKRVFKTVRNFFNNIKIKNSVLNMLI